MSKQAFYTYNPATDDFERYYPNLKDRLVKIGIIAFFSILIGVALFLVVWYGFFSRSEADMRSENIRLQSQYAVLERRVDASMKVMENIRNRDDNFYRVMMQMEPMSSGRRYAGFDYEKSYSTIRRMNEDALIERLTGEVDLLDHLLYSQIQSFDQLRAAAGDHIVKRDHIPGIIPLANKDSEIAAGFGLRRDPVNSERTFHNGIDFVAPNGTSVFAAADGRVEIAQRKDGFGNCIDLSHGYNYKTRYAHLSEILVEEGEEVKRGDLIGKVGSTGRSSQPHLHYEVWYKGVAQNPVNYCFIDLTPKQYSEMLRIADDAGQVLD